MSKITAIMPCRNSAWVLGLSARALLLWVDELIILNHASTDGTLDLLHDLQRLDKRVKYYTCTDEIWREMQHRNRLLESAREWGATHIVTIDDDEIVTGNLLPKMRPWVESLPPGIVMQLPWLQLRGSIGEVITSGMWSQQNASCAFQDGPQMLWQTAKGYDHHHRQPYGTMGYKPVLAPGNRTGGLMHLQMASERRLLAKHAWYKVMERVRWPEKPVKTIEDMYSLTVRECQSALTSSLSGCSPWWAPYTHLMKHLDLDAEPWQEAECRRLMSLHGAEKFRGLDLYGVV